MRFHNLKVLFCLVLFDISGHVALLSPPVHAAVFLKPYLPARAAFRAAEVAVASCQQQGYNVTATVVNTEGTIIAVLRGDEATPHTLEHSFNKAYTTITIGPILKVDSTAKIYEETKHRVGIGTWGFPATTIKGLTPNVGGIALFAGKKIVGGLGVSGAPDGHIDEQCAIKGREAIDSLLR
jgi:uncharacterized protein GlcG (DUF336 family)